MQFFLESLGPLTYSIPAFILVFIIRESIRNFLFEKLFSTSSANPIYYIDVLNLVSYSLTNISWGGLSQKNRKDNLITWAITTFFTLILIGFFLLYLHLNKTKPDTFLYLMIVDSIRLCYILVLTSFIPLPPFDLSLIYWPNLLKSRAVQVADVILKLSLIAIIYFDLVEVNFLKTENFITWLGV